MIHDPDVLPGEAPGGTSSFEPRAPAIDSEPRPPITLGPYAVEYVGRRMGRRVLRICAGRHTLNIFATLDGVAARVSAEFDGKKLTRRRKPRLWRRWSNDLIVKRWSWRPPRSSMAASREGPARRSPETSNAHGAGR